MKKLFALSVLCTLLVFGAYADITVSGFAGAGVTALKNSDINGGTLEAENYLSGQVGVYGQNANTTFGGTALVKGQRTTFQPWENYWWIVETPWGYNAISWNASVWWKPISQFKLQVGIIDNFAVSEIVGWGYNANDAENYVAFPKNSYAGDYFSTITGFYGGTGDGWTGLTLSLKPIYGLEINAAIPFGRGIGKANQNQFTPPTASNIYLFSHVQIAYTLDGIGRAALTFAGGDGKITFINTNPIDPYSDPPVQYPFDPKTDSFGFDNLSPNVSTLYGSVLVTAFEDRKIDVNVGFAYTLPAADKDNIITLYSPMQAGIGLSFGTSKMGFKTRAAAIFGGSAVRKGTAPLNKASMLGFGIMPYYGFGPCKVFLNAGISYKTADELMDGTDGNKVKPIKNTTAFGWTLNPYITLTFDSATVYAGLQIGSDGLKDSNGNAKVEWRIPLGIQYSF